jgi:thioester reductase-like protein
MNFTNPQNILLTGATGVVGARIVSELLTKTDAQIFCLLRGNDINQVKQRLTELVKVYDPQNKLSELFNARVIPILGNVSQKRLGLEGNTYARLLQQIDHVFHAAANVSMIASYKQLAEVNVKGTEEIIDFCLAGRIPLLYTSSYSVMGSKSFDPGFVFKENQLDIGQRFEYQDYEKSKWEAEKRIHKAGKCGLSWIIARLGDVFGDSETACYPLTQTTNRSIYYEVIKSITDTGIFFFASDPLYLTSVDYVAQACVYLARHPDAQNQTFHLCNPDVQLMRDFVNLLVEYGYKVKIMSLEDYLVLFRANAVEKDGKPCSSSFTNLMLFLEYTLGLESLLASDPGKKTVRIDTTKACKILTEADIKCPPITQELMNSYLEYCISEGFISPPSQPISATIKALV